MCQRPASGGSWLSSGMFLRSASEWNCGPGDNPVAEIRMPSHASAEEMRLLRLNTFRSPEGARARSRRCQSRSFRLGCRDRNAARRDTQRERFGSTLILNHRTPRYPSPRMRGKRDLCICSRSEHPEDHPGKTGSHLPVSGQRAVSWQRLGW